jgi:hypothetical protein
VWSRGQEGSEKVGIENHNLSFINIRYAAVFRGLSKSEIKISAGATLTKKSAKYKTENNFLANKS